MSASAENGSNGRCVVRRFGADARFIILFSYFAYGKSDFYAVNVDKFVYNAVGNICLSGSA